MQYRNLLLAAFAGTALAQRPKDTSICDYYTTALLKDNTAENQATILTLIVNTVVVGNYTKPEIEGVTFPDVMVPGILAEGKVKGESVNLLPYFDGTLASSNRGGKMGISINFLDDGGAEPLLDNKPAKSKSSNQYMLLTHLYQFFGTLLGCSEQGMPGFDPYNGASSMFEVHKFMVLSEAEFTYFLTQVGLAAASFGVADEDVNAVGSTLNKVFGYKCSPPMEVIPKQGPELQAICIGDNCPEARNSDGDCPKTAAEPTKASSGKPSSTMDSSATATKSDAASHVSASFGLMGLGLFAVFL